MEYVFISLYLYHLPPNYNSKSNSISLASLLFCCQLPLHYQFTFFCRQYFENSTRETSFIGYSSETTALAVMQATSDFEAEQADLEGPPEEEHWRQVGLVVYLVMHIGSFLLYLPRGILFNGNQFIV